jgi:two-component system chemotaxis response regulator CheY
MQALVVDDSVAMRRIQQKMLEGLGWEVKTASNGEEGLAALNGLSDCRLVLADWHMPVMDGLELCRAIRRDARYARLRIVMVSSDGVLDSVQNALAAGANEFIIKPFTTEALVCRIEEVMRG